MRDLARDAYFVAEPCQRFLVGRPLGWQELERHGLGQQQIVGAVNLAHAAAAEQAHYPVALCQQGARWEAALVHVLRRRGTGTPRRVYGLGGGATCSVQGRAAFPTELVVRWYGGRA